MVTSEMGVDSWMGNRDGLQVCAESDDRHNPSLQTRDISKACC